MIPTLKLLRQGLLKIALHQQLLVLVLNIKHCLYCCIRYYCVPEFFIEITGKFPVTSLKSASTLSLGMLQIVDISSIVSVPWVELWKAFFMSIACSVERLSPWWLGSSSSMSSIQLLHVLEEFLLSNNTSLLFCFLFWTAWTVLFLFMINFVNSSIVLFNWFIWYSNVFVIFFWSSSHFLKNWLFWMKFIFLLLSSRSVFNSKYFVTVSLIFDIDSSVFSTSKGNCPEWLLFLLHLYVNAALSKAAIFLFSALIIIFVDSSSMLIATFVLIPNVLHKMLKQFSPAIKIKKIVYFLKQKAFG